MPGKNASPSHFGTLTREPEEEESSNRGTPKSAKKNRRKSKAMIRRKSDSARQPASAKDDKEELQEENGVLFWVNKSGFPIDDRTWERMWNHVSKIHPEGKNMVDKVRFAQEHPQVPMPQAPLNLPSVMAVADRLARIQDYMRELQYNHTGTQFFEIRKSRPINGLMETARLMIRESLPIKCLEAVILGLFLTNGMLGLERYPISFKSCFNGHFHRHVVLGVSHGGRYGAIGMSRREDLMYKPLVFKSLSDLVLDFEKCYKKYWHEVKKIKIGLPVSHDPHSFEIIQWKTLSLNVPTLTYKEMVKILEQHSKDMRGKSKSWTTMQMVPMKPITSVGDFLADHQSRATTKLRRSASSLTREATSTESLPGQASRQNGSSTSVDLGTYEIRI